MAIFDEIKAPVIKVKIHGEKRLAKPYLVDNKWFNVSKNGLGYYIIVENESKRAWFINVDLLTANDRYWQDYITNAGNTNKKCTAKGYLYINDNGYTQFCIKNITSFRCFASTKPKEATAPHFDNERTYTNEELDSLFTDINNVEF